MLGLSKGKMLDGKQGKNIWTKKADVHPQIKIHTQTQKLGEKKDKFSSVHTDLCEQSIICQVSIYRIIYIVYHLC